MVTLYAEADFSYPVGRRLRQLGHDMRTAPGRLSLRRVERAYVDHMGGAVAQRKEGALCSTRWSQPMTIWTSTTRQPISGNSGCRPDTGTLAPRWWSGPRAACGCGKESPGASPAAGVAG